MKTKLGSRIRYRFVQYLMISFLLTSSPAASVLLAADKVVVVHSALNMLTAPLWVAKEMGFFTSTASTLI